MADYVATITGVTGANPNFFFSSAGAKYHCKSKSSLSARTASSLPKLFLGDIIATGPETKVTLEFVIGGRVTITASQHCTIVDERSVHQDGVRWRNAWNTYINMDWGGMLPSMATAFGLPVYVLIRASFDPEGAKEMLKAPVGPNPASTQRGPESGIRG